VIARHIWPGSSPACRIPRARRVRRFPLIAIVASAAASGPAAARSLTAATEWIAEATCSVLLALGFSVDLFSKTVTVPRSTTVMRLLGRLDGDASFLHTRGESRQSGRRLRAVAVAGKALWLLAAMGTPAPATAP
jgi:hypothetical protein